LFIADDDGLAPTLHHIHVARQCRDAGPG
jgi:hypothetical protein